MRAVNVDDDCHLPAGDFSSWLRQARTALLHETGMEVACGDCIGCCRSSYFIHIKPEETKVLGRIPQGVLVPAPGLPKGHVLMGYDTRGRCPMLADETCSIYDHRPDTCRNYDCRVFAAAGIAAGGDDKSEINKRVRRWSFTYPTERDTEEHRAVRAAASFIAAHANRFPGGRVPANPSQLAVLAIKTYAVFMKADRGTSAGESARSDTDLVDAVVQTCQRFDAGII